MSRARCLGEAFCWTLAGALAGALSTISCGGGLDPSTKGDASSIVKHLVPTATAIGAGIGLLGFTCKILYTDCLGPKAEGGMLVNLFSRVATHGLSCHRVNQQHNSYHTLA